jgi:hypothetical protein
MMNEEPATRHEQFLKHYTAHEPAIRAFVRRLMANRVWHHLFGCGFVRSVGDFGVTGEQPTHPELLDYLALRFVEQEWSVKNLIREIVLTRTWQLPGDHDDFNFASDPDNRFLWQLCDVGGTVVRDIIA